MYTQKWFLKSVRKYEKMCKNMRMVAKVYVYGHYMMGQSLEKYAEFGKSLPKGKLYIYADSGSVLIAVC
jgi:hypothetical protein